MTLTKQDTMPTGLLPKIQARIPAITKDTKISVSAQTGKDGLFQGWFVCAFGVMTWKDRDGYTVSSPWSRAFTIMEEVTS